MLLMHLLCAGPCSGSVTGAALTLQQPCREGCCSYQTMLWVRSMRHREGILPAQGHTAGAFRFCYLYLEAFIEGEQGLVMQGQPMWLTLALGQPAVPVWPCVHSRQGRKGLREMPGGWPW